MLKLIGRIEIFLQNQSLVLHKGEIALGKTHRRSIEVLLQVGTLRVAFPKSALR